MSSSTFTRRTVAGLFLGAVITGAGLAATGTALAGTPGTASGPASYLHGVETTGATPDGTRITFSAPDSRELTITPLSREL
ncbi:hypothetical protein CFP71_40640 [Amycolatopsis thailandensis]|uniref:Uncharacterized protein n=1 Tax=Amycolatopsis thailandensis TaxID=589330 RepID=A0A229RCW9_9PSEU|nr:hypothetical protein [Amycolatopsis thailandensis]OXM44264.1 hypothetical protein CFP71_40640 [Amycolatopsis thailandensis]